jgi:hypothetical protein
MKLKERFKQWLDTNPRLQIREVQLEVIADEFAIEFLDSIREYERENGSRICFDERDSKELLQIFKKEKCL